MAERQGVPQFGKMPDPMVLVGTGGQEWMPREYQADSHSEAGMRPVRIRIL